MALVEICAYAILPLLAVAIRRSSRGQGFGALDFALRRTGPDHLPAALLASLLLVARGAPG